MPLRWPRIAAWRVSRRALTLALAAALLAGSGCDSAERRARALTGGEPARGREALRSYGCGNCHIVPGVRGAQGLVGPPLNGLRRRDSLAGRLPNTPENLMLWIRQPQRIVPGTPMPDLGIGDREARDIAAYLYTLR